MSLYGVISGIHGNREALAACLEAFERRGVDRVVCLGGIVGYNADPDECVALVRKACATVIAGRNDLIAAGRLGFEHCSSEAEFGLRRTRRMLDPASRAYLGALPESAALDYGVVLAQLEPDAAALRSRFPEARACFSGRCGEQKEHWVEDAYFVNPGTVDGSRASGRKLAECALYDTLERTTEFLQVPYDCAAAEAKAAVFGYRVSALTGRLYTLRRRTALAARRIGERLQRAAHSGR
jgi:predicted phosphodiesterase